MKRLPHVVLLAVLAAALLALAPAATAHDEGDPKDGKVGVVADDLAQLDTSQLERLGAANCENGTAGPFPCKNVDLLSFVPLEEMGGATGNDIWGWTDPLTGREYAIMGMSTGTSFVDVTEPTSPVVVGHMPTESAVILPLWRDIKVYENHAFVVSEHDFHGMQVFDLTRLRGAIAGSVFRPDAVYSGFSNAHNIAINEDTGFAYAVGTNTCRAGLHMIDISEPKQPRNAGCYADDGYTHDVQCVIYEGPDGRFRGREICFASNEDTVTIVDVTDKANPTQLARVGYDSARYTHQGWLTEDHRYFLFGDELDESGGSVPTTTTYVMRVDKLTAPHTPIAFHHDTTAIDHNLYVRNGYVFESNYTAGLRILDFDRKSLDRGELREVAYFDVFPAGDPTEYAGTWSNYAYFDSGTVVVSGVESGLFVLRPNLGSG